MTPFAPFSVRVSNQKPHCLFLMNVFYFALGFCHMLLGDEARGRVHTDANADRNAAFVAPRFSVGLVELSDHLGLRHFTALRADRLRRGRPARPSWTCCTITTSSLQTFTTATQPLPLLEPPEFPRLPGHITQGNNVIVTHRFFSTWPVCYVEHIL